MRNSRRSKHIARVVETRNVYKMLVETPEGKRPLRRPRRRQEDNIKNRSYGNRCGRFYWISVAEYTDPWQTLAKTVMNLESIRDGECLDRLL